MKSDISFSKIFDLLIFTGERIPAICKWIMTDLWSDINFNSKELTKYFEDNEKQMQKLEDLIISTASGIYDELSGLAAQKFSLMDELLQPKTAVIIFDGMSLREIPLLKKLAHDTGFSIVESSFKFSSLPSDTVSFVSERILGKTLPPSQLVSRKELKEKNIKVLYYDTPIRFFELPSSQSSYLLWSSFPDGTYSNFEARNALHFETLIKQFDLVWKNIIMAVPKGYRIIVTSDHGYVYLNAGFESSEIDAAAALKFLDQNRFRFYSYNEIPPNVSALQIFSKKNLAMIKGRIKNRPKGHSANKVFRHGGLSLMEMLTPWLVLKRN